MMLSQRCPFEDRALVAFVAIDANIATKVSKEDLFYLADC